MAHRLSVIVSPEQAATMAALAQRHDRSIAAEIRAAVMAHLDAAATDLKQNGHAPAAKQSVPIPDRPTPQDRSEVQTP